MERRKISYAERIQKAKKDTILTRTNISSFPEYKAAINAKRAITGPTAQKAYEAFTAFQPEFISMASPIQNRFPKDSILELNFVRVAELTQLQKTLDEEIAKRDLLLKQLQSTKVNGASYRTLHQRLRTHESNVDIYENKISASSFGTVLCRPG